MTVLGHFKRITERRKLHEKRLRTAAPRSRVKAQQESRKWDLFRRQRPTLDDCPVLDSVTASLIQVEIENMLETTKVPDLTDVASCLFGSRKVCDSFVQCCHSRQQAIPTNMYGRFRRTLGNKGRELHYRFQYRQALNNLETRKGATTCKMTTWDEVRMELCTVFEFPPPVQDNSKDEEDAARRDNINSIVEQFSLEMHRLRLGSTSLPKPKLLWQKLAQTPIQPKISEKDEMTKSLSERLIEGYEEVENSRKNRQVINLLELRLKEKEAKKKAESLLRPLTEDEKAIVEEAIYGDGTDNEIVAQSETDLIHRSSMRTLRPGGWVTDEVIHYFLLTLAKRDEQLCSKDPSRKRCHFFKSFFITKLINDDNPMKAGTYEYRNVKRWSKKVPGKNVFNLNKIFFPINQNGAHWVCAIAFMQDKKIQFYDSMGGSGTQYLNGLLQYFKDEHQAKHSAPLPDEDQWELLPCADDVPQQRNGYDCGIFTCMFADFISKDCPLMFNQSHINMCRHRVALAIMKGEAII